MIPRIYYPTPFSQGEIITLDKAMSHHLVNVLRLKNGEKIILFNGLGGEYTAEIHTGKKSSQALILAFTNINRDPLLELHLGQGVARGDRMDFVVQKATELGVRSITPLLTQKCAVRLDDAKTPKRMQHWHHIAISAAEQSGRTFIPVIHPPTLLIDWVKSEFSGHSLLFTLEATLPLRSLQASAMRLAIGPESGWTDAEETLMLSHQFTACSLGPRILRTETAGLAALSILQGLFGDL